jgi:hypothetical protein
VQFHMQRPYKPPAKPRWLQLFNADLDVLKVVGVFARLKAVIAVD